MIPEKIILFFFHEGFVQPAFSYTYIYIVFIFTPWNNRVSLTVQLLEEAGIALQCTPSLDDGAAALLVLTPGGAAICSAALGLTQGHIEGALLSSTVFARGEASDGQTVQDDKYLEQDLKQAVGLSLGRCVRQRTGLSVVGLVYV